MNSNKDLSKKEKARIARNAYMRKWSRENKEKVKGYQLKHYAKKFDEMQEKKEGA